MTDHPFGPVPLTPVNYLERSAAVFGDRVAAIDEDRTLTYVELADRSERLAGALADMGVEQGDRVSVLAPNVLMALEAHFGVPQRGAVLNALNIRLSVDELTGIVEHAGSRVLLADEQYRQSAEAIGARLPGLQVVVGDDYEARVEGAERLNVPVEDEWGLLSLNYTSGTTGRPKGVMYAHRGAHLQALAMVTHSGLNASSRFLWTLPMFHCNGWCFPWAVTAAGGVHVLLRAVDPTKIWEAIRERGVTHFNAAPTVLADLVACDAAKDGPAPRPVRVATGGAPPSPTLLARLAELNIDVTHLYGLTETYGPAAICQWRPEWDELDASTRASLAARQGVANVISRPVRVVDDQGIDVPADATALGEVVLRGDNVMLGYYKDPDATAAATLDGWFRTGDIAVMHPDGYIELRDRAKDVIISGGENISSIEVEQALDSHPSVLECAVVAAPDERWGEVPVAFVALQPGASVEEQELADHVRSRIARFKCPKRFVFGDLPKTGTGKIQKFALRDQLWREQDGRVGGV